MVQNFQTIFNNFPIIDKLITLEGGTPPDILTASGGVGAARPTARPRESPGSGYNCRKHLTTSEWLLLLRKFKMYTKGNV